MEEGVAFKRKEEEEQEEERKRKRKQKEEEKTPEISTKKAEIESGTEKGMGFGEAKVLTEVKYARVTIKGTEKVERYEPIVKEELAVRLQEEEKKKEEEKRKEEVREQKEKETNKEQIEQQSIKEKMPGEKEAVREAIRKELKEEYKQLHQELDDAVKKGLNNPLEYISQNLLKKEIAKGAKDPVKNVIRILRLAGLLKKKQISQIKEFLKSLIPKMA